jgi:hypothetical protein
MATVEIRGGAVDASPREYPVATMRRARDLREAGWFPTDIRRILGEEGHRQPSVMTIKLWTNDGYQQDHAQRTRRRALERSAQAARFRLPSGSEPYRLAFMRELRAAGVPCPSIGKVCGVVFGDRLSGARVRRLLEES